MQLQIARKSFRIGSRTRGRRTSVEPGQTCGRQCYGETCYASCVGCMTACPSGLHVNGVNIRKLNRTPRMLVSCGDHLTQRAPPRICRPPAHSFRVLMHHPALTPPSLPQTGSYRLPYGAPAPLTRELGELSAAFARRRCYGRGGHVWLCCRVRRRDPPHPAAVVAHRLPRRL